LFFTALLRRAARVLLRAITIRVLARKKTRGDCGIENFAAGCAELNLA
jgi:hypothetical protein